MALEEYRRKRNFGKTPEPPPGGIKARKDQLSYLIQKHDATWLHYDFRLELNGVLVPMIFLGVALLASYVPGRRAMKVDSVEALRGN